MHAKLDPNREPCRSCSRNYVDRYDKIYLTEWLRQLIGMVNDLNGMREFEGVQVSMIEFTEEGADVVLNDGGVFALAKETGRQTERTKNFNTMKIGHIQFMSGRRFADEEE